MARRKKKTSYVTENTGEKVTAAPKEPQKPVDDRLTLDEAIQWFKDNPHEETFISTDKPGSAIVFGERYIKFEKAEFKTSDPVDVELLMRSRQYNLFFYALNPKLRNLKQ